jgi:cob(I)alamin adenosyltransferase
MTALYTGKGDGGTTKTIDTPERISKSSTTPEALGNLDELNSYLGLVKVKAKEAGYEVGGQNFVQIIENIQQNIFTISAGLAGSDKSIGEEKIKDIEDLIAEAEKDLPKIEKFTIAGGTELSSLFDFARTLARRSERRVVAVNDEKGNISKETLKYLNRLSSILFALARLTNAISGIKEDSPSYN